MNRSKNALMYALFKSYTIKDCKVINPRGKELKLRPNGYGYPKFNINIAGKIQHVPAHRLQALYKYGDKLFEKGTEVRHLNGDINDFRYENIAIGSASQNQLDKSEITRKTVALKAARSVRRFTYEEAVEIRDAFKNGVRNNDLAKIHGVSKSLISFIVNKKLI